MIPASVFIDMQVGCAGEDLHQIGIDGCVLIRTDSHGQSNVIDPGMGVYVDQRYQGRGRPFCCLTIPEIPGEGGPWAQAAARE